MAGLRNSKCAANPISIKGNCESWTGLTAGHNKILQVYKTPPSSSVLAFPKQGAPKGLIEMDSV